MLHSNFMISLEVHKEIWWLSKAVQHDNAQYLNKNPELSNQSSPLAMQLWMNSRVKRLGNVQHDPSCPHTDL